MTMTAQEIRTTELTVFKQRLRAQLDDFERGLPVQVQAFSMLAAGLCLGTIHHLQQQQILTAPEAAAYQIELREALAEHWPESLPTFDEMAQRG